MRVLNNREIKQVSGAEHSVVNLNIPNSGVRVTPLNNGTVNVDINVLGHVSTWNSGVAVTCKTFGLGTGLMSLAFSGGNGVAAFFVATVASWGCSAAVSYTGNVPQTPTDDGDP